MPPEQERKLVRVLSPRLTTGRSHEAAGTLRSPQNPCNYAGSGVPDASSRRDPDGAALASGPPTTPPTPPKPGPPTREGQLVS